MNRRSMVALLGTAPLVGGILTLGETHAQTPATVSKFKDIAPRERIRQRYFPDLVLTTHEGKKVRFYDDLIKDKIVIINFMYAKCEGVCPPVTANLVKVQKLLGDRLGRDIFINSFTLKPEQDTPEVLNRYAAAYKTKPGWTFVTGKPADMETIRRKLGFVDPDPVRDADKTNHIGNISYGNEPLIRWGGAPGTSKPAWIVKMVGWVDWPKNRKGERT
ncbi:MAG TPA: SCO family protein [Pyrinomonadaceae bacterium]|nr:SCO family protein [Pyrinomonadaceae bacterium]